jgi:hypothetical protein
MEKRKTKKEYRFATTLMKEDLHAYLLFQTSMSKSGRMALVSIQLLLPLLAITAIIYFKYQWVLLIGLCAVSVFWVLVLSPYVWRKYNVSKVNKVLSNNQEFGFKEIHVNFAVDYFTVDNTKIDYAHIQRIIVYAPIIVFTLSQGNEFILPIRCLEKDTFNEFVEFVESKVKERGNL